MITKCEFCDITLKTDLDASKHLISSRHKENLDKFISLNPLDDTIAQRNAPRDICGVFTTLKLRSSRDVRDLADKGYFNIAKDDEDTLQVAMEMARVMLKCSVEHTLEDFPKEQKEVLDHLDKLNKEKAKQKETPATNHVAPTPVRVQAPRQPDTPRPTSSQPSTSRTVKVERPINNLPPPAVQIPVAQPVHAARAAQPQPSNSRPPPQPATSRPQPAPPPAPAQRPTPPPASSARSEPLEKKPRLPPTVVNPSPTPRPPQPRTINLPTSNGVTGTQLRRVPNIISTQATRPAPPQTQTPTPIPTPVTEQDYLQAPDYTPFASTLFKKEKE